MILALTLLDMYHLNSDCFGSLASAGNLKFYDGVNFCKMLLTRYSTCDVVYPSGELFTEMCNSFYTRYIINIAEMDAALEVIADRPQNYDPFTVKEIREGSNTSSGSGSNSVSAFNDTSYSPDTKQTQDASGTYKETISKTAGNKSKQELVREQYELFKDSMIYEWLAEKFADEMLVCCW